MTGDLVIKEESLPVLKKIFGRMEDDAKMIDGWKRGWQVDRINNVKRILTALKTADNCLTPLKSVGIVLEELEDALVEAIGHTQSLLEKEKHSLEIMDG